MVQNTVSLYTSILNFVLLTTTTGKCGRSFQSYAYVLFYIIGNKSFIHFGRRVLGSEATGRAGIGLTRGNGLN